MAGDTFGSVFRIHNWGESHGPGLGVVVEGCPPRVPITEKDIQRDLDRRRPGQSAITTQRNEPDRIKIFSGIQNGKTTGAPVSMILFNHDQRSGDYTKLKNLFRPSHADFTYEVKYGVRVVEGGGRSSARLLAGSVAAAAIAKKILHRQFRTKILAYVEQVKDIKTKKVDSRKLSLKKIESSIVRCPDPEAARKMIKAINEARERGDSVGGVIRCLVENVPPGLGEPIYDKIEADLAKACLSINATKGFEIGSGFAGTEWYGSEHNDVFSSTQGGKITTLTNHSGGVQGGITNGLPILFRVAFKPTATILKPQSTVERSGKKVRYRARGRHDPCVLPRAVPVVEAMAALVLCDHFLRHRAQVGLLRKRPPR